MCGQQHGLSTPAVMLWCVAVRCMSRTLEVSWRWPQLRGRAAQHPWELRHGPAVAAVPLRHRWQQPGWRRAGRQTRRRRRQTDGSAVVRKLWWSIDAARMLQGRLCWAAQCYSATAGRQRQLVDACGGAPQPAASAYVTQQQAVGERAQGA